MKKSKQFKKDLTKKLEEKFGKDFVKEKIKILTYSEETKSASLKVNTLTGKDDE